MIILGLDPGVADMGYGVVEKKGDSYKFVVCGSIKTSSKNEFPERLTTIYKELNLVIKKYKPMVVGIEELFFAKNTKTAIAVAQARGVTVLTARLNNLPVSEFTPLQIKQALTGYGRADKNQIQQMIKIILKLKEIPKSDDAADALAVAICCGQTNSLVK